MVLRFFHSCRNRKDSKSRLLAGRQWRAATGVAFAAAKANPSSAVCRWHIRRPVARPQAGESFVSAAIFAARRNNLQQKAVGAPQLETFLFSCKFFIDNPDRIGYNNLAVA